MWRGGLTCNTSGPRRPVRLLVPRRCVSVQQTFLTDLVIALPYHPRRCLSPQDAYEAGTLQDVYNGLVVGAEQLTSELVLVRGRVSRDGLVRLYGRVESTPSTGNARSSVSRVVLRGFRGFDRCSGLAGGCPESSQPARARPWGWCSTVEAFPVTVPRPRSFCSLPVVGVARHVQVVRCMNFNHAEGGGRGRNLDFTWKLG